MSILLDTVNMQRTVQLENDRARGVLRHESNIRAGAQDMLVRIQLNFDAIVGNVVARTGYGLLCLRGRSKTAKRQRGAATGEKSWSKHDGDQLKSLHYSST